MKQPFGYTKLIMINKSGDKRVIYDMGSYYITKITYVGCGLIFVLIVIFAIIKLCRDMSKL